jgi:hypothetical protein
MGALGVTTINTIRYELGEDAVSEMNKRGSLEISAA